MYFGPHVPTYIGSALIYKAKAYSIWVHGPLGLPLWNAVPKILPHYQGLGTYNSLIP